MTRTLTWFLVLLSGWLVAGCSPAPAQGLQVLEAWTRPSPPGTDKAALYLTVRNLGTQEDALVAARTEVCQRVEFHETYVKEGGVTGMRPVPGQRVPLPPGATVAFEPGGLHIMCLGRKVPFREGDRFELTLVFERHEPITVTVEVRP